jgi:RNase P subunit RPR2
MKLIKVKLSGKKSTICVVDELKNNYATLCGWQLWNLSDVAIGDEFTGKYTEITCPECKRIMTYFQQIFKTE